MNSIFKAMMISSGLIFITISAHAAEITGTYDTWATMKSQGWHSSDDFDDFDDDFEDFDSDDEEEDKETDKSDTREYVTLNMTENDMDKAAAASAEAGFAVEEDKTTSETDFDIEYHEDVTEE